MTGRPLSNASGRPLRTAGGRPASADCPPEGCCTLTGFYRATPCATEACDLSDLVVFIAVGLVDLESPINVFSWLGWCYTVRRDLGTYGEVPAGGVLITEGFADAGSCGGAACVKPPCYIKCLDCDGGEYWAALAGSTSPRFFATAGGTSPADTTICAACDAALGTSATFPGGTPLIRYEGRSNCCACGRGTRCCATSETDFSEGSCDPDLRTCCCPTLLPDCGVLKFTMQRRFTYTGDTGPADSNAAGAERLPLINEVGIESWSWAYDTATGDIINVDGEITWSSEYTGADTLDPGAVSYNEYGTVTAGTSAVTQAYLGGYMNCPAFLPQLNSLSSLPIAALGGTSPRVRGGGQWSDPCTTQAPGVTWQTGQYQTSRSCNRHNYFFRLSGLEANPLLSGSPAFEATGTGSLTAFSPTCDEAGSEGIGLAARAGGGCRSCGDQGVSLDDLDRGLEGMIGGSSPGSVVA